MPAEARRLQIIQIISKAGNGVVGVADLARQLDVSEMTIRRDLDWLEQRSVLSRVHGGAVAYQAGGFGGIDEKPFDDRVNEASPQKKSIGWAAAQLVNDGDRVILDAGTTTQQVARHLGGKTGLTVITNNIALSYDLARYTTVDTILLGGLLKPNEMCTVGPMAKDGVGVLAADKYFLSAAGFSLRQGVTDPDMREVELKQAMMRAAAEVILVADSSKYGKVLLVRVCMLQVVQTIVTDSAMDELAVQEIEREGIRVITPERMAKVDK